MIYSPGNIRSLGSFEGYSYSDTSRNADQIVTDPMRIIRTDKPQVVICYESELKQYESQGLVCCLTFDQAKDYVSHPKNVKVGICIFSGYSCMRLYLHVFFKGWNYSPRGKDCQRVDYLHIDPLEGRKDRRLYNVKSKCKNCVVPDSLDLVCDKSQMYKNVLEFVPKTWDLRDYKFEKVVIVKPAGVGAYKGNGVKVVTNQRELDEAKDYIYSNKSWKGIVSEYVEPPLLFQGRKFHFRVYMIVSSKNEYSVFPFYHIFTSAIQHKQGDYTEENTDSHGGSTEQDWEYPLDMREDERIRNGVDGVCSKVWEVLKGKIESYPESDYGYELLGLDVMFDSSYQPWLLEVNRKVGLEPNSHSERYCDWLKRFHAWMYEKGILPGL